MKKSTLEAIITILCTVLIFGFAFRMGILTERKAVAEARDEYAKSICLERYERATYTDGVCAYVGRVPIFFGDEPVYEARTITRDELLGEA